MAGPTRCDWCGRPGKLVEFTAWDENGSLLFGNPIVCDVCRLLLVSTAHPPDYWDDDPHVDSAISSLQLELHAKWKERVGEQTETHSRPPFQPVKEEPSALLDAEIRRGLEELEEQGRLSAAIASLVIRLRREGIDQDQFIAWLRAVTDTGPEADA